MPNQKTQSSTEVKPRPSGAASAGLEEMANLAVENRWGTSTQRKRKRRQRTRNKVRRRW